MKKVMFVLAAVACAASVQAATIKWSTGKVTLPGATTNMSASNTALYFWAEDIADPWGSTKVTSAGEGDAVTYTVSASDAQGVGYKTGNATITPKSTYSNGDTAYAAVIITYDSNNDGKIGVGDYYMTGTGSFSLDSDVSSTKSVAMGSWTQITATTPDPGPVPGPGPGPIPEPTSGLLLLLGAGMLALRRKQK